MVEDLVDVESFGPEARHPIKIFEPTASWITRSPRSRAGRYFMAGFIPRNPETPLLRRDSGVVRGDCGLLVQ